MNYMALTRFKEHRNEVIEQLESLALIAERLSAKDIYTELLKTQQELLDDSFKIVVVGEFSRGKSTFINALLGKKVLPMSTRPTTTILNIISYAPEPVYRLYFREGKKEPDLLSEEGFKKIVAPLEPIPGDKQSEKEYVRALAKNNQIASAHIGYPTSICKEGIEIVDTPGTNDVNVTREEITIKYIPRADAAIVLLSAKAPLAGSEFNFIKDRIFEADIKSVFFVVNFKDCLESEEQEKKVINHIYKYLKELTEKPKIFLVSAKEALITRRVQNGESVKGTIPDLNSTGFPEFEEELASFLTSDRSSIKLAKPISKGMKLGKEMINIPINLSLGSLNLPVEKLEAGVQVIELKLKDVRRSRDKLIVKFHQNLHRSAADIREEYEKRLKNLAVTAKHSLDDYHGSLDKENISSVIEEYLAPFQAEIHKYIRKRQEDVIREEVDRIGRILEEEWDEVVDLISTTFMAKDVLDTKGTSLVLNGSHNNDDDLFIKAAGYSGLGFIGLVGVIGLSVFFALPAAIFGGVKLFGYFATDQHERKLWKITSQVEKHYRQAISPALKEYDRRWEQISAEIDSRIKEEMERRVRTIQSQLDKLLKERYEAQQFAGEKKLELQKMLIMIKESSEILEKLGNKSLKSKQHKQYV